MKLAQTTLLFFSIALTAACKKPDMINQPTPVKTTQTTKPIVVVLGSSTAEGIGATPADSCWADRLQTELLEVNSKTQFFNLAMGGYTTYQAMPTGFNVPNRPAPDTTRNITRALQYKPTLVLISFPSNDISEGFSYSEIVRNYKVITQKLDSAKIAYIIFSTQPRNFSDKSERMRLKALNDTVRNVYTSRVNDFLDTLSTSTYTIKPGFDSGDGIHVNNGGHTIIFNYTLAHPIFKSFLQSCK